MKTRLPALLVASSLASVRVLAQDANERLYSELRYCDEILVENPQHPVAYRCYWIVARRHAAWDRAVERAEQVLAARPLEHRARLSLALLEADLGNWERSFPLFDEAVAGFSAEADARGEIYARHNLAYLRTTLGDLDEAEILLDAGGRVADAAEDPMLKAAIHVERGYLAHHRGDFGRAWDEYSEAEKLLVENHPNVAFLRSRVMTGLADAAKAMARYRDAMEIFDRRAELLEQVGNPFDEAFARLNVAWMAERLWREGKLARDEVRSRAQTALQLAVRAANDRAAGEARLLHASFLPERPAEAELQKALSYGLYWGERAFLARVYRRLSQHARERGGLDRGYAERALDAARESGNPTEIAASLVELAEVEWAGSRPAEALGAVASWDLAIEAVENIRNLQPDDTVRARFLADWSPVYYRLASLLLEAYRTSGDPVLLEKAFQAAERQRSRVLLDRLDAAHATPPFGGDDALAERRGDVLSRIVATQRELLSDEVSIEERRSLVKRLSNLERSERSLRGRLLRIDPRSASLRAPVFPSLSELESSLQEYEAVLSFHLPGARGAGGELPEAWLQVSTRRGTRVYALPSHEIVDPAVDFYRGLVRRRDGAEELGAKRLYDLLLAEAVRELPPSVDRLLVIPDGSLHELPFAALNDGKGPLVLRYEVSVAPSVTAALRWRSRRGIPSGGALVLADPVPIAAASRDAGERAWALARGGVLGALPHAREEGRTIVALVGRNSRLLEGEEASERYLKSASLAPYAILHFATHGLLDETNPERSAILLSPGGAGEDGLLQLRDLSDIGLSGKLVVLSACRSASGELVRGEGVVGIGRAFFQAGSQAVVGGLWSLDDREASVAFEAFYRHLVRGASVAAALRAAQVELIGRGADAAAWAGIVALGDVGFAPLPAPRPGPWLVSLVVASLVLALVLVLVLVLFRSHRGPLRPD